MMIKRFLKKLLGFRRDNSGAALLYVTIAIPTIFAITSMAIDVGYVFYVKTKLQTAADMGALAGASKLYTDTATNVNSLATTYVNNNIPTDWTGGNKPSASSTPEVKCLTAITNMGLTCSSLSGGNALKVTVSATVPLLFAKALGWGSVNLKADSMVSGGGSSPPPLNVAIILDATASMGSYGGHMSTSCGSLTNPYRIECATLAAKTLLTKLWASVDQVALYTYPSFTANSPGKIACTTGATGSTTAVNYQTSGNPNYQMFGFNSTYADTNNPPTTGLNTSSPLVLALGPNATAGVSNGTSCNGLNGAAIGKGTSIGDAIAQAQRDLTAANVALVAAGKPARQNVMIILSDGDANGNSGSCTGSDGANNDFLTGMDNYGNDCTSTWVNDVNLMAGQCQAAVNQAVAASGLGTWVYAVAFGSEYTVGSSCFTDRPVTTTKKTATSSPKIAASENFQRACTSAFPCQAKASTANTVSSIIAAAVTSGSAVTQDAFTAWGGTIATSCKLANGTTNAPDGTTTSGATCTTTVTNATKVQKDSYNLKSYNTTACDAMRGMASDPSKFYSTDGNTLCSSAANPNFTDLVNIFNNVAASIMKKRRIPSSTT